MPMLGGSPEGTQDLLLWHTPGEDCLCIPAYSIVYMYHFRAPLLCFRLVLSVQMHEPGHV